MKTNFQGEPGATEKGGEYAPAGEDQGVATTFTARQVADAFEVAIERVHRALQGEFALAAGARIDSRQAQHLAEAILGDRPQDARQAALMKLGAFTPRTDHDVGLGERGPGEESDRLERTADRNDEERT